MPLINQYQRTVFVTCTDNDNIFGHNYSDSEFKTVSTISLLIFKRGTYTVINRSTGKIFTKDISNKWSTSSIDNTSAFNSQDLRDYFFPTQKSDEMTPIKCELNSIFCYFSGRMIGINISNRKLFKIDTSSYPLQFTKIDLNINSELIVLNDKNNFIYIFQNGKGSIVDKTSSSITATENNL